jgi:hypothetical protein
MALLKKLPLNVYFFLFSLTIFAVAIFRLPGASADPTLENIKKYSRDYSSLRNAVVTYHNDMNELFDAKIKILLDDDTTIEQVKAPGYNDDGSPKECESDNVSTYCVSLEAADLYFAFQEALVGDGDGYDSHVDYYFDEVEDAYSSASEDPDSARRQLRLDDVSSEYAERYDLIQDQLEISQRAMNVTLSAYNELYKYYNLHKEYEQVITDLEAYRDELSEMRKWVERYPKHFHDRTTTACT